MANSGKNKRRQLEAFDKFHNAALSVDSVEEKDFINWLNEAIELSVITDFDYQPPAYQLAEPVKYVDVDGKQRTLFREHIYSTDFVVEFDPNFSKALSKELKVPYSELSSNRCSAFIDTKGTFNRNSRSFGTDRKWVWQKYGTYIYELVPQKFFKDFGVPENCRLTEKTKKPRSAYRGFPSISEAFGLSG